MSHCAQQECQFLFQGLKENKKGGPLYYPQDISWRPITPDGNKSFSLSLAFLLPEESDRGAVCRDKTLHFYAWARGRQVSGTKFEAVSNERRRSKGAMVLSRGRDLAPWCHHCMQRLSSTSSLSCCACSLVVWLMTIVIIIRKGLL
jgi:hypothetical protein